VAPQQLCTRRTSSATAGEQDALPLPLPWQIHAHIPACAHAHFLACALNISVAASSISTGASSPVLLASSTDSQRT
jgi:hypothetical protein